MAKAKSLLEIENELKQVRESREAAKRERDQLRSQNIILTEAVFKIKRDVAGILEYAQRYKAYMDPVQRKEIIDTIFARLRQISQGEKDG